jgi:predicted nucleic acid-binding protein
MRIVQDTNVFVAALRSGAGASRLVLESCLRRTHQPLMAQALWLEYRDVLSRADLWKDCALTSEERGQLLDDFAAACLWVQIWFLWRPNLPDEGDNHLAELAIAGNAAALVTFNVKDFQPAKFAAAGMKVLTPAQFKQHYLL